MKKYTGFLLCLLLTMSTTLFANSDRAVMISLSNSDKTLNSSDVDNIRKAVAQAINDGIVDTFLIHENNNKKPDKFLACVAVTKNTAQDAFTLFVNNLHRVNLNANVHYQLKTTTKCGVDALICLSNPLSCFNTQFIRSTNAFSEYVAKAQFKTALDEITVGKLLIEIKLNEAQSWILSPADMGLPALSHNCSSITVDAFDPNTGFASISCTIQGITLINGAVINWTRMENGKWVCSAENGWVGVDIYQYSGNCKGH